ncbi:metal ABC transporter ATP-binding protein [Candidatus Bathyarchaeota archaeon]|nr:metal ABC transporter ATP-binding protein [Candidatus Bathyarchaeota archaeon]
MADEKDVILKVKDLGVKLQNQILLDNISFNVRKGTTVAILGPNGAGKTVLLRALLNRLPHTGEIEWTEKVKLGYVPQYVAVSDVPMTVKEFLSIEGCTNPETALAQVRLTDKSLLDKRLGVLSGGQLRRVLIAWALNDNPNVLLLDEPTTGVDMDSEEPIYLMLNDIKKNQKITILLITHNIHIVEEYTDDLLAINKCVTYCGPSAEIAKPEIQRQIYGEPMCVETARGEA